MNTDDDLRLGHQIRTVAGLLADELTSAANDPLHSLASARSLDELTNLALHRLVRDARGRGVSWQRLGDALGTTRQAAFQRFGTPLDPRTGQPMTRNPLPDAAQKAAAVFDAIAAHRWEEAMTDFSSTLRTGLGPAGLPDAYAAVVSAAGELEHAGAPQTLDMAGVTVVDIPLEHEAADLTGRISFAPDGSVIGLWFVPRTAPTP